MAFTTVVPSLRLTPAADPAIDKAKARINTLVKRQTGFHPNRKWTLQLPYSDRFNVGRIEKVARTVVAAAGLAEHRQRKVKDKANPRDATPEKQPAETSNQQSKKSKTRRSAPS